MTLRFRLGTIKAYLAHTPIPKARSAGAAVRSAAGKLSRTMWREVRRVEGSVTSMLRNRPPSSPGRSASEFTSGSQVSRSRSGTPGAATQHLPHRFAAGCRGSTAPGGGGVPHANLEPLQRGAQQWVPPGAMGALSHVRKP